jgi:hypothetical protein
VDVECIWCKWERRGKQKENLREGDHLEDLGIDGEDNVQMWRGELEFSVFRIMKSGRLL